MNLRNIDIVIAELFMGWHREVVNFVWDEGRAPRLYLLPPDDFGIDYKLTTSGDWDEDCVLFDLPSYSSNMSDAWKVVEKLCGHDKFYITRIDGIWKCDFGDPTPNAADTAPLAICRAALRKVGVMDDVFRKLAFGNLKSLPSNDQ